MILWDILNNIDDLNDKVDVFNSLFGQVVECHTPISQMSFKRKGNPWITPAIREAMKTCDQLLKKARNTNQNSDCTAVKVNKKELKNSLKTAKSDFVQSKIKKCNISPWWVKKE